jgi:hypothetical protein
MAAKPDDIATTPADVIPDSTEKATDPAPASTEAEKNISHESTAAPIEGLQNLNISEKKTEDGTSAVPPSGTTQPTWPTLSSSHPLTHFLSALPALITSAGHSEVYGITLDPTTSPFHTKLILQKFLRANANDLEKAKQQLLETLKWRKEFDPTKAVEESFEKERFEGLGYVLVLEGVPESVNERDVVTFNIYGAVGDKAKTFGDLEG